MAKANNFLKLLNEVQATVDRAKSAQGRMVVVTFDLEPDRQGKYDYDAAYKVLHGFGLNQTTKKKEISLPRTTVLGRIKTTEDARTLRKQIRLELKKAGVRYSRILVGFLDGWNAGQR